MTVETPLVNGTVEKQGKYSLLREVIGNEMGTDGKVDADRVLAILRSRTAQIPDANFDFKKQDVHRESSAERKRRGLVNSNASESMKNIWKRKKQSQQVVKNRRGRPPKSASEPKLAAKPTPTTFTEVQLLAARSFLATAGDVSVATSLLKLVHSLTS